MQFFNGFLIVAEIFLAADKDDGKTLAEMKDFGDPLTYSSPVSTSSNPLSFSNERASSFLSAMIGRSTYLLLNVVQ